MQDQAEVAVAAVVEAADSPIDRLRLLRTRLAPPKMALSFPVRSPGTIAMRIVTR